MVIELLKEKNGFTTCEIQIANYILDHTVETLNLTLEELAIKSFTSKASVIRLCKKVKVSGYREFLRKLEKDLNDIYRIDYLKNKIPINEKNKIYDIVNIIPSIYEMAISQTKLLLDFNVINRVVNKIICSDLVEIYSVGISQAIAEATVFKLNSIGINCVAFGGLNEYYIMNHKHQKNKVAILLTFSGKNPYIIKIAQYLKKHNYYIIGIGGSEHKELDKLCCEFIEIYTKELILNLEMMTSYTATNYILDIIFMRILSLNHNKIKKIDNTI